jgi:ABC-type branched-subunit amino acid transport system ATPase component
MPSPLQLKKIAFASGSKPGASPLTIQPGNVTLLVGPNNSGKSRLLREIEGWVLGDDSIHKVSTKFSLHPAADAAAAEALLRKFETIAPPNHGTSHDHIWVGAFSQNPNQRHIHNQVYIPGVTTQYSNPDHQSFRTQLVRYYTARLDGRMRFGLSDPQESGDLQATPKNHLWALFVDDSAREEVRAMTEDAFNLHFVIDATAMTQFRARMSTRQPASKAEEQGLDASARAFHKAAQLLTDLGDGVQTYTGLIAAVSSFPHKLLLIDEPEAFLHPPLARRLGANLSRIAVKRDASLVVATHSADFVMGCLEASPDTSVVRLTYTNGVATARALAPTELKVLLKDPLVRSTGALRGMFHRSVIVTEAERDRAFYDEINRRMQEGTPATGVVDALFVNAQNWQTTYKIAGPLRRLGIPAPVVLDIDTIADGNQSAGVWTKIYDACAVSATDKSRFDSERAAIHPFVQAVSRVTFKQLGIGSLGGAELVQVTSHINNLAQYGIFIVPLGEVEGWLRSLGATAGKEAWLSDMFGKLGDDSSVATYVRPTNGDVWDFLTKIASWCHDANRLGIP